MEEDIQQSHISSSSTIKRIDERLKAAIALASEKLDRESAHDKDLLRALSIMEARL